MTKKVIIADRYQLKNEVVVYDTQHPQLAAKIAIEFAQHYGMIAGMPDGEDSSGRQKLRLLTPEEVAVRSMEVADKLVAGCQQRGWFLDLPDLAEINGNPDQKKK